MRFATILLPLLILMFFLIGCNDGQIRSTSTGNPTPKDFLENEDADIFQMKGLVYSNAEDVEWVTELDYALGEKVGEITKQAEEASEFKNGTANKLPVGTEIFETDTSAYIAIVDGKEIAYLKMVEG